MIHVVQGDITTLAVDALVNAANASLLGGGGVDGAIHRAAGPRLREHCETLGGCPAGEARLTPGFDLPARWVIHTVGPMWHGGYAGEPEQLRSCYEACFRLAREKGVRRIAFPAISTGAYRFPKKLATRIAIDVMSAHQSAMDEIICCCFSDEDRGIYAGLLADGGEN